MHVCVFFFYGKVDEQRIALGASILLSQIGLTCRASLAHPRMQAGGDECGALIRRLQVPR